MCSAESAQGKEEEKCAGVVDGPGADARAVPSARKQRRMGRRKTNRQKKREGKGKGAGVGGGQVWPSMQVIRLEGAECVLCMRMSH